MCVLNLIRDKLSHTRVSAAVYLHSSKLNPWFPANGGGRGRYSICLIAAREALNYVESGGVP